ncbi:MAG: signal peptidase I [Lachnospiraceae bacterium]|nr:signal peptidase I [Lachnospiraceae bacterium]
MRRHRRKGLNFYHKKKIISASLIQEIASWVLGIVVAVFLAFVLTWFAGLRTSVIGVSMEPGLTNGQEILVNRFSYKLFSPRQGDVIVFLPNGNQNAHYYVKRVVAVPGQKVQIRSGILYVDGKAYGDEDMDLIASAGIAENEIKLGDDEYFVMGDNFNSSEDSRSANIGPVKKSTIIGQAWFHFGNGSDGLGFIK